MAEHMTVVGHELRYMPRKQEADRNSPGRFIDYEPAYVVITRLQGVEKQEGTRRLIHVTLATSRILPDDFDDGVQALYEVSNISPVGQDLLLNEGDFERMKDARVWSPFANRPESPRQGTVVGYLTLYIPSEQRRERRNKVLYAPQVVPYLSVQAPNDDDVDRIIHVRLLNPGAPEALVGDGRPSEMMRQMYAQMQHVPPLGVPIGSTVRVGVHNGDYRLLTEQNEAVSMSSHVEEEASA